MNDYRFGVPSQLGIRPAARLSTAFLTQAFVWMFAGLLLTAGVAFLVQSSAQFSSLARTLFLPSILVEFGLVMAISVGLRRLGPSLALGLFFVYAALNGLTFGLVFAAYSAAAEGASVGAAFLSASAAFGGAAVYGATTRRSLVSLGGLLFMGLIGLIVAMLVNLFLGSSLVGYAISVLGVLIFTGLTAYDVQRIATGDLAAWTGSMEKAAVYGALRLYLDFVNLFLMFLRLFGGSRR